MEDPGKIGTNEDENADNCPFSSIPRILYSEADFLFDLANCKEPGKAKAFGHKLLESWQLAAAKGVLNYETGNSRFRQLQGNYGISLQLNANRCLKRRKPHQFHAMDQPFDDTQWNFTRLKPEECLFQLGHESSNSSLLAINASPLSPGHSLLIPTPQKRLPQVLTAHAVQVAIELALLVEKEGLLLIYNSLLGHASVNQLHLQALFWPSRSGLLGRQCRVISTKMPELFLLQRPRWYLPAFVLQLGQPAGASRAEDKWQLGQIARTVANTVQFLIARNMAHNLFICRSARLLADEEEGKEEIEGQVEEKNVASQLVTLFLFPRRISTDGLEADSPLASSFVPAALEVAGLVPVYDSDYFDTVGEEDILRQFDQYQLISDDQFGHLARELVAHLLGCC